MNIAAYGFAIWETFYVTVLSTAFALFAGQLCLLRFVQLSELPKGLPLAAGVLVLCMVLQCIRLAARSEYIAEA